MAKARRKIHCAGALVVALCTLWTAPLRAQDSSWDYGAFLYLWGAGISGTTTSGQDFEMSFSDVLDKLDIAAMGAVEARRNRFSLLGDLQYLKLSEGKNAAVGPGIPATVDAAVKGTVFTGSAGYDILTRPDSRLTLFGGVRYLNMDSAVNLAIGGGSRRAVQTLRNWDAVIGLRGRHRLAERWHLAYLADIGAGESDLTWQASVTLDYRINNWDLSFGYRHMKWEIGNSAAISNVTFAGPFIGAKIHF